METNSVDSTPKRKIKWTTWLLVLLVVASLGTAAYFWKDAQDARSTTPEAIAARNAEDTERVLNKVDNILLTESEEDPTVARIDRAETLREANEDFYGNAEDGDYLILYTNRAVIYRESENRLINVAPIVNTNPSQFQQPNNQNTDTNSDDDTVEE